jgi:hypothetical protein
MMPALHRRLSGAESILIIFFILFMTKKFAIISQIITILPEVSLPHSQVPVTCLYPEPAQSIPCFHIPLPEDPS